MGFLLRKFWGGGPEERKVLCVLWCEGLEVISVRFFCPEEARVVGCLLLVRGCSGFFFGGRCVDVSCLEAQEMFFGCPGVFLFFCVFFFFVFGKSVIFCLFFFLFLAWEGETVTNLEVFLPSEGFFFGSCFVLEVWCWSLICWRGSSIFGVSLSNFFILSGRLIQVCSVCVSSE